MKLFKVYYRLKGNKTTNSKIDCLYIEAMGEALLPIILYLEHPDKIFVKAVHVV